mmetsp:Transcript_10752/g.40231  ORF Transcript_10752/g.40231 Transcript_10752/m.40231 type:complete len:110 (+) Transcript_10752:2334-2663(+)
MTKYPSLNLRHVTTLQSGQSCLHHILLFCLTKISLSLSLYIFGSAQSVILFSIAALHVPYASCTSSISSSCFLASRLPPRLLPPLPRRPLPRPPRRPLPPRFDCVCCCG